MQVSNAGPCTALLPRSWGNDISLWDPLPGWTLLLHIPEPSPKDRLLWSSGVAL